MANSEQEFPLGGTVPRPIAINDLQVVVGFDSGDPIKWEPTAHRVWGEPVVMEELGPSFTQGAATGISNGEHAYAANYRLIADIDFGDQVVLVVGVMTHEEYSRDHWKESL